ncbi:MAG: methyl-accepting chemotaxis protein [Gammaproteobacteria bacterium]
MFKLNLKIKILAAFSIVATISIITTSVILLTTASSSSQQAIEDQVKARLLAMREIKKAELEEYLHFREQQIKNFSTDPYFVSIAQEFTAAFKKYPAGDIADKRTTLTEFYKKDFTNEFAKLNTQTKSMDRYIGQLSDLAIALQFQFLSLSESTIGNKHDTIDPDDESQYAEVHSSYHTTILQMLTKLNLDDILIADAKGTIVYSAMKNIDFATSLTTGPLKDQLLGIAFKTAIEKDDSEFVTLTDLHAYLPTYNNSSAFILSPIQDLLEEDAFEILGTLIFKLPSNQINNIMTSQNKWKNIGLGMTGESYIVGSDKIMRSISRELVEHKDSYFQALNNSNINAEQISKKNTTLGLLPLTGNYIDDAIAGNSGIKVSQNYLGREVLTAYTPFTTLNMHWAIVSEILTDEAFEATQALATKLISSAIVVTVIMVALASLAGGIFSVTLTKPIIKLKSIVHEIDENNDLTKRVEVTSKDEIGQMSSSFNHLLAVFHESITQVAAATGLVATAADLMTANTAETRDGVTQQFDEVDQVATAINEMSATVQEVARNAEQAAKSAEEANEHAVTGNNVVQENIKAINRLSSKIQVATDVIQRLSKESENIGSVLDVIKGIAEQTNLLALNAAIEAARAGEQGRGFAVVADEVRTLAGRTQQSTVEIETMITALQQGTKEAVKVMEQSQEMTEASVLQASMAGDSLQTITSSINSIMEMNTMIASAAEEQSAVTEEINKNIVAISQLAQQTTEASNQTSDSSSQLTELAQDLQVLVSKFKT